MLLLFGICTLVDVHASPTQLSSNLIKNSASNSSYLLPISLNLQNIPVRQALQLFANFIGINIVIHESVRGTISLQLHDLPWEQAINIILTAQGLKKQQVNHIWFVDKLPEQQESNKAKIIPNKRQPLAIELIQLHYAKAEDIATVLSLQTNSLLSKHGAMGIDKRTNTIWLQDTKNKIQAIKLLMKHLDKPSSQVMIEARIVNMSRHCSEDLGIRFGISQSTRISGTLAGANKLTQGISPALIPMSERLNLDLGAIPLDASPASVGIALAKLGNHVLLDLELSALESEGRAEIIASPRLLTSNQQPATIESGEDIPYQESNLNGATSIAFKKAVLSLKVTPQINPDGKLQMDLLINQDSDSGRRVQGVPIILTKSISTSVIVNNGQTLVLGGIYKHDKNNMTVRVPFLSDLPGVGKLFSYKQVKKRNEELLIFITPRIINKNKKWVC